MEQSKDLFQRLQKELHDLREMQHQAIDSHHGELHEDEDHNHGGEDHHEENNPE